MILRNFFFLLTSLNCLAQSTRSVDFDVPVHIPLLVAGSFGELRPNHFHAGTDLSANYRTGDPVYAPADGVVNRIKVSSFGYGKALYIKHANGYTTVYGHLNAYASPISEYVNKKHYEQQQFEIELFPLKGELPVKKGDVIGYIGNTGGSGGPHLHYEIRNTKNEHILNPIVLSLKEAITDTEQPIINGLFIYPLTETTVIDGVASFFEIPLHKDRNVYKSEPVYAKGTVGFGINTHDTQDGSRGKNGIYKILTYVNGTKNFEIVFDEFSFDESKYLNQYIDYKYYIQSGNRIQKLFLVHDLPLSLIKTKKNGGMVSLEQEGDFNYKIEVYDAHLNKQTIEVPITYKEYPQAAQRKPDGKYIDYLKDYAFEQDDVAVEWDARTFFEDAYLNIQFRENAVILHKDEYPLQKNINIRIRVQDNYPNKDKTFIGQTGQKKVKYFETWKKENDFRIRTKELGTYELIQDLEPPSIQFTSNRDSFTSEDELLFEIEDGVSGIGSYKGFLNDEWILFDYDYKTKKLVHKLSDKKYTIGTNTLRLEVEDRVGNNSTFEQTIVVN